MRSVRVPRPHPGHDPRDRGRDGCPPGLGAPGRRPDGGDPAGRGPGRRDLNLHRDLWRRAASRQLQPRRGSVRQTARPTGTALAPGQATPAPPLDLVGHRDMSGGTERFVSSCPADHLFVSPGPHRLAPHLRSVPATRRSGRPSHLGHAVVQRRDCLGADRPPGWLCPRPAPRRRQCATADNWGHNGGVATRGATALKRLRLGKQKTPAWRPLIPGVWRRGDQNAQPAGRRR